jgi:hypothetical protein
VVRVIFITLVVYLMRFSLLCKCSLDFTVSLRADRAG